MLLPFIIAILCGAIAGLLYTMPERFGPLPMMALVFMIASWVWCFYVSIPLGLSGLVFSTGAFVTSMWARHIMEKRKKPNT